MESSSATNRRLQANGAVLWDGEGQGTTFFFRFRIPQQPTVRFPISPPVLSPSVPPIPLRIHSKLRKNVSQVDHAQLKASSSI